MQTWNMEKESWATAFGYLLVLMIYFALAPFRTVDGVVPIGHLLQAYVLTVVMTVLFETLRAAILKISTGKYPLVPDERDRLIQAQGLKIGWGLVMVALNLILIAMLMTMNTTQSQTWFSNSPLTLFHMLFGLLFLGQIGSSATMAVIYWRTRI